MIRCFKFLVCTLLISIIVAEYNPPPFVRGRPRKGLVNHWLYTEDAAIKCDPANGDTTEDKYLVLNDTITQYVDHFDGNNKATWKQRYQYNSKFFDPNNATIFLMLGGESPILPGGEKWITCENITMMQWAKEFRAAAFQLEHRFYGPSEYTPFGNVMRFFILLLAFIAVALAQFPGGHNNAGGLGERITEDNPPETQAAEGISINEGSGEDDSSSNVDEVRTAIFHSADQVHAAAAGAAAARRK